MHTRSILLLSSLITCVAAYVGHADAGGWGQGAPRPALIEAKPIRDVAKPMSRAEGREAADAAVAGALMGLVNEQFGGERIEIKLDSVDMRAVSPRDREVAGTGQLKVGADTDWLPFRYRALYDTETQTAAGPAITLGSTDAGGTDVAPTEAASTDLARAASERLRGEFPDQKVTLDLSKVQRQKSGRYERYIAIGGVRFDRDPATKAAIEGLYDPARKRWLRINYELGDTAGWQFHDGTAAVAVPGTADIAKR